MIKKSIGKPSKHKNQMDLPLDLPDKVAVEKVSFEKRERFFKSGNREELCFGDIPLREYLLKNDDQAVVALADFLETLDYEPFYDKYDLCGRRPFHPKRLLALVLFGTTIGQESLRGLEKLGKNDLRAMYLLGGLQPDHSTLGKFLLRHETYLQEDFFVALTQKIFEDLGLASQTLAGDGTIIQAVSARLKSLTAEAAKEAAAEAARQAQRNPDDLKLAKKAQQTEEIAEHIAEIQKERDTDGRYSGPVRAANLEPEARVLKGKQGVSAPAYTPSATVDENHMVVGIFVDPTSETKALEPMLDQHRKITGEEEPEILLDGNYHQGDVLKQCVDRGVDVLCPKQAGKKKKVKEKKPDGKKKGKKAQKRKAKKTKYAKTVAKIPKEDFRFDEDTNCYICPAGKRLSFLRKGASRGREYDIYQGSSSVCEGCLLRESCTTSPHGRTVNRYENDIYCEEMRRIMKHPGARKVYEKRRQQVELFFAALKERLKLKRFRRRGLSKVRMEFSLHCMVYNIGRGFSLGLLEYLLGGDSSGIFAFFRSLAATLLSEERTERSTSVRSAVKLRFTLKMAKFSLNFA